MNKIFVTMVILAFICAGVWFGLPMSVFSEDHPTATVVLKVIGTICGVGAIIALIKLAKKSG